MEIMKTLTIGGNTYEIADEKMRKALEDGGVITKVETTVDSLTGKVSNKFTLSNGDTFTVADGASGVYVGSGTPPANATVWINPEGEPTSTEDWEFDLDDGSTEEKTVVVVGSDDATASGKLAILRMKDVNGNWVEIPAIVGTPGKDGYTPQKGVDYFDGTNGKDGSDGKDGVDGKNGSDGKSAYQYAKDGGYTGTEAEFMAKLATAYLALAGGTMNGELVFNGGDQAGESKIVLETGKGQITNSGTQTLFGFLSTSQIGVGHSSYALSMRGNASRPLYNNKDIALQSDLNRSTAVNAADTNYSTLMARGTSLNSAETTPAVNGAIAWTYE